MTPRPRLGSLSGPRVSPIGQASTSFCPIPLIGREQCESCGKWHRGPEKAGQQLVRENGTSSRIDAQLGRRLKSELDVQAYTSRPLTVTGLLITAKFVQHGAEISLPKLNRTITFTYPAESEDELIDRRRDWVQITGSFKVDEDSNPVEAIEVTSADPLDLSPMHFDSIESVGLTLRANTPLILTPKLDEEINQYLEVSDPEIDLLAFGRNRDELADAVAREIACSWQIYARENPEVLTPSAQRLAMQLKAKFTEELHAVQTKGSGESP